MLIEFFIGYIWLSKYRFEDFYDETRRVCDLRLVQPYLMIAEDVPANKEEKIRQSAITNAMGFSLKEMKVLSNGENGAYRRRLLEVAHHQAGQILEGGDLALLRYLHAAPISNVATLSKVPENMPRLLLQVWVSSDLLIADSNSVADSTPDSNLSQQLSKVTVKIDPFLTPRSVIKEVLRKMVARGSTLVETAVESCDGKVDGFLLKVCCSLNYLLTECPLIAYEYVRGCIKVGSSLRVLLLRRAEAYAVLPAQMPVLPFQLPAPSVVEHQQAEELAQCTNLWQIEEFLEVEVKCAMCVNVRETGRLYARMGVYHGSRSLCPLLSTRAVSSGNPRWNEPLKFELFLPDIPRNARLCMALYYMSPGRRRKFDCQLGWANLQLMDYQGRFVSGKRAIALWQHQPGASESLNPLGTTELNRSRDAPQLEIELPDFCRYVAYPAAPVLRVFVDDLERRESQPGASHFNRHSATLMDDTPLDLEELQHRDPLSELSTSEQDALWNARQAVRRDAPQLLPRIVESVRWHTRIEVCILYGLLRHWPTLEPHLALQLLDSRSADTTVRAFAVYCLQERASDLELEQYLLQLVQVLKLEPYLESSLTTFLLQQALTRHCFGLQLFWFMRAELYQATTRCRFGLLLEAFCRGCGPVLSQICAQTEALERLARLTELLKTQREDEQLTVLRDCLSREDYSTCLENIISPMDNSNQLGGLRVDMCKIKKSKKRPLWLVWDNPDPLAAEHLSDYKLIYKNGDDLRQDMLTLQLIRVMDRIWKQEGMDLQLTPYACLATGPNMGLIEVVRDALTVMGVQKKRTISALQMDAGQLHRYLQEVNSGDPRAYKKAVEAFTRSCAGYCVATFVLGIRDRHPDNIMVNTRGQLFHIDFGKQDAIDCIYLLNFELVVRVSNRTMVPAGTYAHTLG